MDRASPDIQQYPKPWQFGLRQMLIVVSATAVFLALYDWKRWPPSSAIVCIALLAALVFARPQVRNRLVIVLFCAYSPYAWLLTEYPWSDYRWGWIGMWPILPGLLPGAYFFHGKREFLEFPCMALATLVMLMLATTLAKSRRWVLVVTAVVVTGLSLLNSFIANALYRA